jgi:tRNA modification GTPase
MSSDDTIFALSSGQVPAAIGIIRISGPGAQQTLKQLAGQLPKQRVLSLVEITNAVSRETLDVCLCAWFPGPNSATGEDLAEIHCHGGRAVVRAIEEALERIDGLRRAEPGEFTRRAYINGVVDLAEAEGLSDLLAAETELQRRLAIGAAGGALSQKTEEWQEEILRLSAMVEAELDFSDEDDVAEAQIESIKSGAAGVSRKMRDLLDRPRSEKLRDGVRVVLGGPPNSGKSTLLNALVEREAAIVSDIAGTTRDVLEIPVAIGGIPFLLIDTAGVRDDGAGEIERQGIDRAHQQFELADIILWLGPEDEGPSGENVVEVAARSDHPEHRAKLCTSLSVSPVTGEGMAELVSCLQVKARDIVPQGDEVSLNQRQADHLSGAQESLDGIAGVDDYLIIAEHLRIARASLDAITGKASTEDMLDALFGKFCIGK